MTSFMTLKEALDAFTTPVYGKTKRTSDTYKTVATYYKGKIENFVKAYGQVVNDQQLLREIRNDIDASLRRYHKYCIQERDNMGAHYHHVGATATDFEHLIPLGRIRDLLLAGAITVEQALNAPTVTLCKDQHKLLGESGWGDKTPDMWLPFKRYANVFEGKYQTYDGTTIDPNTWTLEKHFEYFKHLVV